MPKVLIVDDSQMFREELRSILESAGYSVVEACDGFDGLQKAKANDDVDMILCDFNMPEMNGIQMVPLVKEMPAYENTPVFFLSTESSPELKVHAKEVGVTAWIIKPFIAEKLLECIEKVLVVDNDK